MSGTRPEIKKARTDDGRWDHAGRDLDAGG
jgi:hypothetical protein